MIGLACADALCRRGVPVLVFDQGELGKGCSHGNCGLICPSHVLPLAEPDTLKAAWHSLWQRNPPLLIGKRWDPGLWYWLIRFACRCHPSNVLPTAQQLHPLLSWSRRQYPQLIAQVAPDCEWSANGLLYVYKDTLTFRHYEKVDELLRDHFQLVAERYDSDAIQQFEPQLSDQVAGGWFYPQDAHLRPDKLMTSWLDWLRGNGVQLYGHCGVREIVLDRSAKQARGVSTSQGWFAASAVVVATGAWTPRWSRQLRCPLPIQPGKGYSVTIHHPTNRPSRPLIFPESRVAVTPWPSGLRLGSMMEFVGYDASLPPHRIQKLFAGCEPYLTTTLGSESDEQWMGWRPMTWDSLPIIGPIPHADNVFIAAGHNMLGLSMAPATGQLIADWVMRCPHSFDPEPYLPSRFL